MYVIYLCDRMPNPATYVLLEKIRLRLLSEVVAQVHKHLSPASKEASVARTGAPVVEVAYPVDSEVYPAVEPVATRASVAKA